MMAATLVVAFVMLAAFAFVRAVILSLWAVVAFSLVEPRRLPRCWSFRSSSCFSGPSAGP